jgi:carbon storage regulator CsrA
MLIVTRKLNEQIVIGQDIKITVVRLGNDTVRLGVDAPKTKSVVRSELRPRPRAREGKR